MISISKYLIIYLLYIYHLGCFATMSNQLSQYFDPSIIAFRLENLCLKVLRVQFFWDLMSYIWMLWRGYFASWIWITNFMLILSYVRLSFGQNSLAWKGPFGNNIFLGFKEREGGFQWSRNIFKRKHHQILYIMQFLPSILTYWNTCFFFKSKNLWYCINDMHK